MGVQKISAKILTMEAKTVKTNKRMKSCQKWLALEKGPRAIAPKGAKLWLFKEGNRLWNFSNFGENCSSLFKRSFLRPGVEFCKNSKT